MESYLNATTVAQGKELKNLKSINNHTVQEHRTMSLNNNRSVTISACEQVVFPTVLTFQGVTQAGGIQVDLPSYILPQSIYSILVYSNGNLDYIRDDRGGKNSLNTTIETISGVNIVRLKFGHGGGNDYPFTCSVMYSIDHTDPPQPIP